MLHSASLFEVQTLAVSFCFETMSRSCRALRVLIEFSQLMGMYLRSTTAFPGAWVIVSIGLRRAIDAGAHRKRVYRETPNRDDELWKRAFWHLVVFDRIGSATLGRGVGIGEEESVYLHDQPLIWTLIDVCIQLRSRPSFGNR